MKGISPLGPPGGRDPIPYRNPLSVKAPSSLRYSCATALQAFEPKEKPQLKPQRAKLQSRQGIRDLARTPGARRCSLPARDQLPPGAARRGSPRGQRQDRIAEPPPGSCARGSGRGRAKPGPAPLRPAAPPRCAAPLRAAPAAPPRHAGGLGGERAGGRPRTPALRGSGCRLTGPTSPCRPS